MTVDDTHLTFNTHLRFPANHKALVELWPIRFSEEGFVENSVFQFQTDYTIMYSMFFMLTNYTK